MPRKSDIPNERFLDLLAWLDPNPSSAASTYLDVRDSLVRILAWRQCADPEGMADEVFDRVCGHLPDLQREYRGNPKLYCYGVANNLVKEYLKARTRHASIEGVDVAVEPDLDSEDKTAEMREDCLSACLQELPQQKREQILSYYAKDKHAKIVHRAAMAQQLGISLKTLRVRMSRLRSGLEKCIERCLERHGPE